MDPYLSSEDISPEGSMVLKALRQFYLNDTSAMSADISLIKKAVLRRITNPKHTEIFDLYFHRVHDQDISAINVAEEVLATKREVVELALAEAILAKNQKRIPELIEKLTALNVGGDLDGEVHEEYQSLDVGELLESFSRENLIRVAPPSLNRRIGGGVLRGHHIVVVAYPEVGKTLVSVTMLSGFVAQGLKCLYIGNEDPIKSVVLRFISCLTGMTPEQVAVEPHVTLARAKQRGYDQAVFAGLSGGTLANIRSLVTKHKPDVLIVDQIRNITSDAENRTLQLETVARSMRNFAREFDLVAISITQGADSARGKLNLDLGDVDGSNVGIPGTADIMLMIGMNADFEANENRQLTLAKNKISGVHTSWPVSIRRDLSRIIDVGDM
jgi:KaiC/GvpD/RAD55 family RecA-like ATPase